MFVRFICGCVLLSVCCHSYQKRHYVTALDNLHIQQRNCFLSIHPSTFLSRVGSSSNLQCQNSICPPCARTPVHFIYVACMHVTMATSRANRRHQKGEKEKQFSSGQLMDTQTHTDSHTERLDGVNTDVRNLSVRPQMKSGWTHPPVRR